MHLLGFDDDDRAFVSAPAAVLGLVTVLVLGVALGHAVAESRSSSAARSPTSGDGARDCRAALAQARTALDSARQMDDDLTVHTQVIIDLRADRLTTKQALARSEPVLVEAARRSTQLDVATQRFLQLADGCSD